MKRLHFFVSMTFTLFLAFLLFGSCSQESDLFDEVIQESIDEQTNNNDDEGPVADNEISSELKAFPSAYGAGAFATGGRGGRVIYVTNLNDSGPGSLREAVMSFGPRIVVFNVSGTIELKTNLNILDGNITIAGQTAPKGGITLTGSRVIMSNTQWTPNVNNIIIRYIKVRPDLIVNGPNADCLQFNNVENVVLDHLSTSWGGDEAIEFRGDTQNITIQRTIMAESNTASIFGSELNVDGKNVYLSENLSFNENLIYDTSHRFPNTVSDGRVDVINNVVYNFRFRLTNGIGGVKLNHINNYFHGGSQTKNNPLLLNKYTGIHNPEGAQIFSGGNLILPDILLDENSDNWSSWATFGHTWTYKGTAYSLNNPQPLPESFRKDDPFELLGAKLPVKSSREAYDSVIKDSGANKSLDENGNVVFDQDNLDKLYISNITYNNPSQYVWNYDWRVEQHYQDFHNSVSNEPLNVRPEGFDTDKDGMPDEWEIANGFNPDIDDSADDNDGDGYTNVEEYLNRVDF
nr:hypothetical protein [uncultured Allomuricauda sp.]